MEDVYRVLTVLSTIAVRFADFSVEIYLVPTARQSYDYVSTMPYHVSSTQYGTTFLR